MGGNFCPGMRIDEELPGDQREDDEKSVVFDSDPLPETLAILGAPEITFTFSCDKPNAMIVARLCDVASDGSSTRVSLMPLNLTHLYSHETPVALIPGKTYRVRIKMADAGHVFAEGHRVRLAFSNGCWPLIWPSAETTAIDLIVGESSLTLPIRAADDNAMVSFDAPNKQPDDAFEVLRDGSNRKDIDYGEDGVVTLELFDNLGHTRSISNGLETASTVRHSYRIKPDDPLSAKVEASWTFETRRGNWQVNTRSSSAMTCDETHFHLSAQLEAFENGEAVFKRSWQESVERDHV